MNNILGAFNIMFLIYFTHMCVYYLHSSCQGMVVAVWSDIYIYYGIYGF